MPDQPETLMAYAAILTVALTVLATRSAGLLTASLFRPGPTAQRIINSLPGCAMAAIVAPAVLRGSLTDIAAVVISFALYLWTGRTILSLLVGISLCLIGAHWRAGTI